MIKLIVNKCRNFIPVSFYRVVSRAKNIWIVNCYARCQLYYGSRRDTVQRLLADVKRDRPRLPRRGPEQANWLARQIPVEQKKATLIRAYLGHDWLDTVAQTLLLNRLYELMGLYYNLFQPVMRLAEKTIVSDPDGHFVRVKRRFDPAQTPLDRLCASAVPGPLHQQHLEALRDSLNPRQLRRDIYSLLDRLFALPCASPDDAS
jgi:hypothetical protein